MASLFHSTPQAHAPHPPFSSPTIVSRPTPTRLKRRHSFLNTRSLISTHDQRPSSCLYHTPSLALRTTKHLTRDSPPCPAFDPTRPSATTSHVLTLCVHHFVLLFLSLSHNTLSKPRFNALTSPFCTSEDVGLTRSSSKGRSSRSLTECIARLCQATMEQMLDLPRLLDTLSSREV